MTFRRSRNTGTVVHRLDLKRTPRAFQRSGEESAQRDPASMRRGPGASEGLDAEEKRRQLQAHQVAQRGAQDPASQRRAPSRPDTRALDEAPAGKLLTGWGERRMADGLAEAADRDERQREEIQRLKRRLENLSEQLESESSARESARDPISRPAATQEPAEVDASRHALMDQILRANLELQKRIASLRPPAE